MLMRQCDASPSPLDVYTDGTHPNLDGTLELFILVTLLDVEIT